MVSNKIVHVFYGFTIVLFLLSISSIVLAIDLDGPYTLQHEGRTRYFKIYVPSTYDGSVAVPLMVDVHAYMSNAWGQSNNTRYDVMAEKDNFIIVYPRGTGFLKSWNGGDGGDDYRSCCGSAVTYGVNDVGFMLAIVDWMKARYNIDRTRIYGSGLSNGSALMQKAIIEHPDVFAAIYVAAQFLLELPAPTPSRPIPIMLSHGLNDTTAAYDGNGQYNYPSAQENFARWAGINGCTEGPVVDYRAGNSYCEVYRKCNGGVNVKLCSIDGDHVHYDNADNVPIAQMGWDFVKSYALPQ